MPAPSGQPRSTAALLKRIVRHLVARPARERIRDSLWQLLSPRWRLPSGLVVEVHSDQEFYVYTDLLVSGEYDVAIDLAIAEAEPAPLVLDLGANVGYFALRFADRWLRRRGAGAGFRLVCVEGSPKTYTELERRMSQPLLVERCRCHFGLAGRRAGQAYISTATPAAQHSIVGPVARRGSSVPFLDLETLLPDTKRIALLKCDIEGAEEIFLQSYPDLLKRVDLAVLELHRGLCDAGHCVQLLAEAGLMPWRGPDEALQTPHLDLFRRAAC